MHTWWKCSCTGMLPLSLFSQVFAMLVLSYPHLDSFIVLLSEGSPIQLIFSSGDDQV